MDGEMVNILVQFLQFLSDLRVARRQPSSLDEVTSRLLELTELHVCLQQKSHYKDDRCTLTRKNAFVFNTRHEVYNIPSMMASTDENPLTIYVAIHTSLLVEVGKPQ